MTQTVAKVAAERDAAVAAVGFERDAIRDERDAAIAKLGPWSRATR
jgi:hypothetical protein